MRADYDNIRLGHCVARLGFDQKRRTKAKEKVKGVEKQSTIEHLEMIIKEYHVNGDRIEIMEERFPSVMAARVERLKRQILEEERDQSLAEGQAVWIIQRAWRRYLIVRDIRREEEKPVEIPLATNNLIICSRTPMGYSSPHQCSLGAAAC